MKGVKSMEKKSTNKVRNLKLKKSNNYDVAALYRKLIEQLTYKQVEVIAQEMSNGKYGVEIISEDVRFWSIYKSWDSGEEIIGNVLEAIEELSLTS